MWMSWILLFCLEFHQSNFLLCISRIKREISQKATCLTRLTLLNVTLLNTTVLSSEHKRFHSQGSLNSFKRETIVCRTQRIRVTRFSAYFLVLKIPRPSQTTWQHLPQTSYHQTYSDSWRRAFGLSLKVYIIFLLRVTISIAYLDRKINTAFIIPSIYVNIWKKHITKGGETDRHKTAMINCDEALHGETTINHQNAT